jgi:hypothetical protein
MTAQRCNGTKVRRYDGTTVRWHNQTIERSNEEGVGERGKGRMGDKSVLIREIRGEKRIALSSCLPGTPLNYSELGR